VQSQFVQGFRSAQQQKESPVGDSTSAIEDLRETIEKELRDTIEKELCQKIGKNLGDKMDAELQERLSKLQEELEQSRAHCRELEAAAYTGPSDSYISARSDEPMKEEASQDGGDDRDGLHRSSSKHLGLTVEDEASMLGMSSTSDAGSSNAEPSCPAAGNAADPEAQSQVAYSAAAIEDTSCNLFLST